MKLIYAFLSIILLCSIGQISYAQDDILDAIEAELKAEQEKKKAAAKAAKNEDKFKANYDASIRKGDAYIRSKKYDDAIEAFESAKKWGPTESYPEEQIALAKQEKSKQEEAKKTALIEEKYKEIISKADALFNTKKYTEAILAYQDAKDIDPSMAYPNDQIIEAKTLQAKLEEEKKKLEATKKLDEAYNLALKKGDDALKKELYDEAVLAYNTAEKSKPNDPVIKARIELVKKTKADAEARAEQEILKNSFDETIKNADELLASKSYDEAIKKYTEAANILPENTVTTNKIKEATALKEAEAQRIVKAKYDAVINAAEALLLESKFDEAKNKFEEASKIQPHENYPKTKMKECSELKVAAAKAELEAQYDALIKEADALLDNENFELARKKYAEAQVILPHELHPKNMISEANTREKNKANLAIQEQYESLINQADKHLAANEFDLAIEKYNEAKKVIPKKTHSDEMLKKIELLKKQKIEAQTVAEYNEALKTAEALMYNKKYEEAILGFEAAHLIMPKENKTIELIAEAKKLIIEKEHTQLKMAFDEKITEGETLMHQNNFDDAISKFEEAAAIMPQNKTKTTFLIDQTKKLRDDLKANELTKRFNSLLEEADNAILDNNFTQAKLKLSDALAIIPSKEAEIDLKIAQIEELEKNKLDEELATKNVEEKQNKFNNLIAEANQKEKLNDFSGALLAIDKALGVFPNNSDVIAYKSKLDNKIKEENETALKAAEINKKQEEERIRAEEEAREKIAEKATIEKQEKIEALIEDGDKMVVKKDFYSAIDFFEQALILDPSNSSIGHKIINVKSLQKQATLDNKKTTISNLLSEARNAVSIQQYALAHKKYNQILKIDPNNADTHDDLIKLKTAKEKEKVQYTKLNDSQKIEAILDEGYDLFAGGKYEEAINAFKKGVEIDPLNKEIKLAIHDALEQQTQLRQIVLHKKHKRPNLKTEPLGHDGRIDKITYQNKLGLAYPQGVTESQKEGDRRTTTTRVVVKNKIGSEYKKIKYDWGGTFFFKNGESIGSYIWQYETRESTTSN